MAAVDTQVAVIGGGVVGSAVVHALARGGVETVLLEAETGLALGASGTNSGILHTGFDSKPGALETELILRSVALRGELLPELGVPARRCGALLRPNDDDEREAVRLLAQNAAGNGVEAHLDEDGSLTVPGETVTDPVLFTQALADAARRAGATVRLGARVTGLGRAGEAGVAVELQGGERLRAQAVVNCAGLYADEVARMAGDELVSVYPRKGEFLVFSPPPDAALEQILLPVPSKLGKGVLVFPTLDGHVIAGPTAREREDKRDWSVEADAAELILPKALRMYPPLERATRIGSYAGLRPAGRDANYVIESSRALAGVIHVAAIRSTGLSASLGIAEHVTAKLARETGIALAAGGHRHAALVPPPSGRWWERAGRYHGTPAVEPDAT